MGGDGITNGSGAAPGVGSFEIQIVAGSVASAEVREAGRDRTDSGLRGGIFSWRGELEEIPTARTEREKWGIRLIRELSWSGAGLVARISPMVILEKAEFRVELLTGSTPNIREARSRMTKILLVEDSKFLRLASERALTRAGYEVFGAMDGDEALLLAREKMPDLVLLDMLLPKMSGLDVLKALKESPETRAIPVVVLTGMSQKNSARLQADGAFGFLEKAGLEMDKGSGKLLAAVAEFVKKLPDERTKASTA